MVLSHDGHHVGGHPLRQLFASLRLVASGELQASPDGGAVGLGATPSGVGTILGPHACQPFSSTAVTRPAIDCHRSVSARARDANEQRRVLPDLRTDDIADIMDELRKILAFADIGQS